MKLAKFLSLPAIALSTASVSAGQLYIKATPKLDSTGAESAEFVFTNITEQLPAECQNYEFKFETKWEPTYKLLMKAAKQGKSVTLDIYHTPGNEFDFETCRIERIKYNIHSEA